LNWWANAALSVEVLTAYRLRTALSISGIVIGVAAVIIMVAVGFGAERQIVKRIESMGTNLVFIVAGKTRVSGGQFRRSSLSKTLKPEDVRAITAECPSVQMAAGSIKRSIIIRHKGETVKTGLIGIEPEGFVIRNLGVTQGRAYTEDEERAKRRVVVFAPTAAKNTFGEESPLGEAVRLARQPFRVIGLTAPKGMDLNGSDQDDKVFVPLSTAMRRLVNVDYLDTIFVKVRDGRNLSRAEEEIKRIIRKQHKVKDPRNDDFSVYNQLDLIKLQKGTARTLTLLITSAASLAWLVGGIGILAVMLMAVRERRSEIGLRRALGARDVDIRYQFLFEAGILAGAGGMSGLLIGLFGTWLTAKMGWGQPIVSWPTALGAISASIILGLICGYYPATRAARLTPIEALGLN
jgi:putative ABC transport system permease protein